MQKLSFFELSSEDNWFLKDIFNGRVKWREMYRTDIGVKSWCVTHLFEVTSGMSAVEKNIYWNTQRDEKFKKK